MLWKCPYLFVGKEQIRFPYPIRFGSVWGIESDHSCHRKLADHPSRLHGKWSESHTPSGHHQSSRCLRTKILTRTMHGPSIEKWLFQMYFVERIQIYLHQNRWCWENFLKVGYDCRTFPPPRMLSTILFSICRKFAVELHNNGMINCPTLIKWLPGFMDES